MMNVHHEIYEFLKDRPWAVTPMFFDSIPDLGDGKPAAAGGLRLIPSARADGHEYSIVDRVAVIRIYGLITKRPAASFSSFAEGVSTEMVNRLLAKALMDPHAGAIVLDVDSPGGLVDGTAALSDKIYSSRWQKPIVAFANGMMCSAAYWIGSAASKIVASVDAQVGSIGVMMRHVDRTRANLQAGLKVTVLTAGKYKAAGHPDVPLTDELTANLQEGLNCCCALFIEAVARNRNFSKDHVSKNMAEGRVFIGEEARKVGLVDRIGALPDAINYARELASGKGSSK